MAIGRTAIPAAAIIAFAPAGVLLDLANLDVPALQFIPRAVEVQIAAG